MRWKTRYGSFAVRVYRALIDPLLWPLRLKILRICREPGIRQVLDIASATGAQCRWLARAGISTTGIDLSEPMIAAARKRSGENTRYVCGSALELPFDDGSFDACLLALALHEHPESERTQMIEEARRVLRNHGVLVIADFQRPRRTALHIPWHLIRAIERTSGQEHRAGFNDFVASGGLSGLLDRHELIPDRLIQSHYGTIGIAVIRHALNAAGRPEDPLRETDR